jgi:hypothetical protein
MFIAALPWYGLAKLTKYPEQIVPVIWIRKQMLPNSGESDDHVPRPSCKRRAKAGGSTPESVRSWNQGAEAVPESELHPPLQAISKNSGLSPAAFVSMDARVKPGHDDLN